MHRRELLVICGSVTGTTLAGCLGSQSPYGTSTETPMDTPAETPASGDGPTRWAVELGDEPTRPAVGPLAYVGAGRTAYGLDPFSGDEVWTRTFDVPTQFFHVHGDTVYAITYEDPMGSQATVAALGADDGDLRWTFEFDGRGSVIARGEDVVVLKTYDDAVGGLEEVYAFDKRDGSRRWWKEMYEPKNGVVNDGTLFVANGRGVSAYDIHSGSRQWRYPLDGYQFSSLTVGPETVVGVNKPDPREPELFALTRSGIERWTFDEWVQYGPTIHDGHVFTGGEHVASFDGETGNLEWKVDRSGTLYDAPVVDGSLLAGGDTVRAYSVEDGVEQWSYDPEPQFVYPEAVRNGRAYVHTSGSHDQEKRYVFAVDVEDGSERWMLETETEQSDLAIGRQGAYVSEKAGTLYALS